MATEETSRYVADPGGYEVRFSRSIKNGQKMHTVKVQWGELTVGASGRTLSEAFQTLSDRLDEKANGGPIAAVVWGADATDCGQGGSNDD